MEKEYKRFNSINYKNCEYKLINNCPSIENTFTVVIGRNAIGKSSLLSYLIKIALAGSKKEQNELTNSDEFVVFNKIIALSTTPFDKFPTEKSNKKSNNIYKYLGYKSKSGPSSKNSQLAKIISNLFLAFRNNNSTFQLNDTFKTLGYHPRIRVIYRSRIRGATKDQYLSSINRRLFIEEYLLKKYQYSFKKNKFSEKRFDLIARSFDNIFEYYKYDHSMVLDVDFTDNIFLEGRYDLFESLSVLIDEGLVNFQDLKLYRSGSDPVSINSTSSGERCLFINILGIASVIENNSLICIDEPEISLHPEWQEKYMHLLMKTFSSYDGCQFVIATHSPQLISNLTNSNCYILAMDNRVTHSNNNYAYKSSDYQLAKLFKSPGFNNEYLLSELLEILALLSEGSSPNQELLDRISYVIELKDKLSNDDPVKKLTDTLQKVSEMMKI